MIGIIFLLNIRYAPYLNKYTDILKSQNKEFEIIYWDRLNSEDHIDGISTKIFKYESDLNKNKFSKIKDFYRYRQFLIENIKDSKYEKLIILTTLTGILLVDTLLKEYKGKYILDIRDYSFEKNLIFKKIVEKLVKGSYFTAISSKGFLHFLPKSEKYVIAHNFRDSDINAKKNNIISKREKREIIRISFLGSIRHFDLDIKFIEFFKNDRRFELEYVGDGPHFEKLKTYVSQKKYKVLMPGRFSTNEKTQIFESVDIINGYYDEKEYINKYAISNKFYDCIIYQIPILANEDVFLGQLVSENGLGFSLSLDNYSNEELSDYIYNEYLNFDFSLFREKCEELLIEFILEDNNFKNKILEFINKKG